jgi:hypothetical protein
LRVEDRRHRFALPDRTTRGRRRLTAVMLDRLQNTRMRLLDLYRSPVGHDV